MLLDCCMTYVRNCFMLDSITPESCPGSLLHGRDLTCRRSSVVLLNDPGSFAPWSPATDMECRAHNTHENVTRTTFERHAGIPELEDAACRIGLKVSIQGALEGARGAWTYIDVPAAKPGPVVSPGTVGHENGNAVSICSR